MEPLRSQFSIRAWLPMVASRTTVRATEARDEMATWGPMTDRWTRASDAMSTGGMITLPGMSQRPPFRSSSRLLASSRRSGVPQSYKSSTSKGTRCSPCSTIHCRASVS